MIMCCCWLKPSKFSMIMKVVNKNTEDRGRKSKCKISKDKKYHVNSYLSCSEQLFRSWSETLIINRPGFISLIAWISLLVRNIDFWLISLIIFFFFVTSMWCSLPAQMLTCPFSSCIRWIYLLLLLTVLHSYYFNGLGL